MPSAKSPSMPTPRQIEETWNVANRLCPGVRIKGVGPEGVVFEYPEPTAAKGDWEGRPFSGEVA